MRSWQSCGAGVSLSMPCRMRRPAPVAAMESLPEHSLDVRLLQNGVDAVGLRGIVWHSCSFHRDALFNLLGKIANAVVSKTFVVNNHKGGNAKKIDYAGEEDRAYKCDQREFCTFCKLRFGRR